MNFAIRSKAKLLLQSHKLDYKAEPRFYNTIFRLRSHLSTRKAKRSQSSRIFCDITVPLRRKIPREISEFCGTRWTKFCGFQNLPIILPIKCYLAIGCCYCRGATLCVKMVGGFEFRVLDTRIIAASPDATDSEQIPDIQGCVANSRYHFDSTMPLIQSRLISCQYDDSREKRW